MNTMNNIIITLAIVLATTSAVSAATGDPEENTLVTTSGQSYTIQEIISRLKGEIAKGTAVYNPSELQILKSKLHEEQRFYKEMISNS